MMERINCNQKVGRTILFLFLFLATILFFESSPTSAKYEEKGQEVLKYQSTIALVEKEKESLSLVSLDDKEAVLEFSLPKDYDNVKENEEASYKVLLPDFCTNSAAEDIVFSEGENERKVVFTCNLEEGDFVLEKDGNYFLELSVQVLESVHNEMYFLYKEYDCSEKVEALSNESSIEENPEVLQFKQSLIQNILTNSYYQSYEKEITSYITDAEDPLHLPGLQIDYQEYYQYTYVIEDNFVGYACTYYENKDQEEKNSMYFTESDPVKIDQIFSYYLKEYFCSYDMNLYYIFMNYIVSTEKISDVILNGKSVLGISYDKNQGRITIENDIYSQLENLVNEENTFIYRADEEQKKGTFLASVNQNQSLSLSLKQQIMESEDLMHAVVQDMDQASNRIDYLEVDDGQSFVILEISRNENYNKITILPVSIVEDVSYYHIAIDCNRIELSSVDVDALIDLMAISLSLERENDLYQIYDSTLSFQLKKPETVVIDVPPSTDDTSNLTTDPPSSSDTFSGTEENTLDSELEEDSPE